MLQDVIPAPKDVIPGLTRDPRCACTTAARIAGQARNDIYSVHRSQRDAAGAAGLLKSTLGGTEICASFCTEKFGFGW